MIYNTFMRIPFINIRIPLTKYGWPEVFKYPAAGLVIMFMIWLSADYLPGWAFYGGEILFGAAVIWILSFFRDPGRDVPVGEGVFVSPADGRVVEVERLGSDDSPLGCESVKVGIFLSVFNVHINRSPCGGVVDRVSYKEGEFRNALNDNSSKVNERNDVYIRCGCVKNIYGSVAGGDEPVSADSAGGELVMVRQISGAIARRIVCGVKSGDELTGGERFGMIKFGSRTELYLPFDERLEVLVNIGDKVLAGSSVIARCLK